MVEIMDLGLNAFHTKVFRFLFFFLMIQSITTELPLFLFQSVDFLPDQGMSSQAPADQCRLLKLIT